MDKEVVEQVIKSVPDWENIELVKKNAEGLDPLSRQLYFTYTGQRLMSGVLKKYLDENRKNTD